MAHPKPRHRASERAAAPAQVTTPFPFSALDALAQALAQITPEARDAGSITAEKVADALPALGGDGAEAAARWWSLAADLDSPRGLARALQPRVFSGDGDALREASDLTRLILSSPTLYDRLGPDKQLFADVAVECAIRSRNAGLARAIRAHGFPGSPDIHIARDKISELLDVIDLALPPVVSRSAAVADAAVAPKAPQASARPQELTTAAEFLSASRRNSPEEVLALFAADTVHAVLHRPECLVRIVSREDMAAFLATPPSDHQARKGGYFEILSAVAARGGLRKIVQDPTLSDRLLALRATLPNFGDVLELLAARAAIAQLGGAAIAFPPILLAGSAGIGKSFFANEIAAAIDAPVHRLAMDTAQSPAALAGSESYWSNSAPGLLFNAVLRPHGMDTHPVTSMILLDEIDKAPTHSQYPPLAPLHTLLEPETARSFKDQSIGLPFDASHLAWVATANRLDGIDKPLLNRFEVFEIEPPTREQSLVIASSLVRKALQQFRLTDFDTPDEDVLATITTLPPRDMRKAVERAIGRAAMQQRRNLVHEDFAQASTRKAHGIGFLR
ncbi:MAG: AAA family ATPase [Thiomonas sp.]